MLGARLKFDHVINHENGHTAVNIIVTIGRPTGWLWAKILGKNQQSDLERSTRNLIKKAERTS